MAAVWPALRSLIGLRALLMMARRPLRLTDAEATGALLASMQPASRAGSRSFLLMVSPLSGGMFRLHSRTESHRNLAYTSGAIPATDDLFLVYPVSATEQARC